MADKETTEQKKKDEKPAHVQALFQFFIDKYKPAEGTHAGVKKTTIEIFQLLQEHCPSMAFSPEDIFIFLTENKFTYATPGGDMDFVWLMDYKKG